MELSQVFPVWSKLTGAQQARLTEVSVRRQVKTGTVLHDGSPECLGMLLVEKGQLRAYMLSDEGREITVSRFFDMDICLFSASCVMRDMHYDVFIEAEKDTDLWVIPACLYQNLMDESLAVSNYSHSVITSHFSDLMWLMEQIMWKSFDKRLAAFLLEESTLEGTATLQITHERIANHLGTAREVVTRMLRYFQNEGMVRLTRGTVQLTDEGKLRKLST